MYGFATVNSTNLSDYENRTLWLEVIMGSQQGHSSHHTLKVSHNRLGQTLQRIQRQGGKVIRVAAMSELELDPIANSHPHQATVTPTNINSSELAQTSVTASKIHQQSVDEQPPEKVHRGYKPSVKPNKSSRREKKSKHKR